MSWWNRSKKIWLSILGGLLFLFLAFVAIMRFMGPRIGNDFCTLAGCYGGLGIAVEGLPDGTIYDLDIQYIHGREQTLTCEMGKDDDDAPVSPFVNGCVRYGVAFTLDMDEKPPEEITVTVTANGKKISKVFRPTYKEHYPNGKECGPVCYSSTIVIDVSQ